MDEKNITKETVVREKDCKMKNKEEIKSENRDEKKYKNAATALDDEDLDIDFNAEWQKAIDAVYSELKNGEKRINDEKRKQPEYVNIDEMGNMAWASPQPSCSGVNAKTGLDIKTEDKLHADETEQNGGKPSAERYINFDVSGADYLDIDFRDMYEDFLYRHWARTGVFLPPKFDALQQEDAQAALMNFRYLEQELTHENIDLDYYFDDIIDLDLDITQMQNRFLERDAEPAFVRGVEVKTECQICFDNVKLHKRICCDFPVCDPCIVQYIETSVDQGIVKIQCLSTSCDAYIYRDEIVGRLQGPMKDKFYKFLVDANKDPKVKTCPRCSSIFKINDTDREKQTKFGLLVTCPECRLDWCFECQAPWHQSVKCKDYRKGDKLVKTWAKEKHFGTANAQRCPKCKIFIERKGGCDHMTCSKCETSFCYKCGGRYLDLKFFGNHLSTYSPLGCKYNYKPDKPVLRRFVRGSVLGAKLLAGIGLVGLGIAAVGVLVGASVVILPVFGGYKYHKHRKFKRHLKRQQELIKMRSKNAMMELHRERSFREEAMLRTAHFNKLGTDTVHIGIQAGQSQQVDVTVHNPYHPPDTINEETQNAEIRMNITNDRGQVTVTTAEISHNSNPSGEGSEAGIVLHVKTTYPKPDKESNHLEEEKVEQEKVRDTNENLPDIAKGITRRGSTESVTRNAPNAENQPKSVQVHRRVQSTGTVRKNIKKQEFGSISRKWLKSAKKNLDSDIQKTGITSDQEKLGSMLMSDDKKLPGDKDQSNNIETLTQSGCFSKLLGKKLNSFQVEKEKSIITKSDSNLVEQGNCPDVVSCALEAEKKHGEENGVEVKVIEKDKYLGLVSKENSTTAL